MGSNGWLVKACHDSVTQVQILLERYTRCIDRHISVDDDLCSLHSTFYQRVDSLLKIVAERKRMTVLRRGRDISYSPLPAQLLASTSRKRNSPFDDASCSYNSIESSASEYEGDGDDDYFSDVSISPSVIQRALQFQTPTKSSLKSVDNISFPKLRNVRFDVSDSASLSSSPV